MKQPTKEIPQEDHISICICTYKRPHLIKKLLEKLERLETNGFFTYSIVVVENDHEQVAKNIVLSIKEKSFIKIDYYVEPRQNISHARNLSVKKAEGNLVAFIDDDEVPHKKWLLNLYLTFKDYHSDGVLGSISPQFVSAPPNWIKNGRFFFWRDFKKKTGIVLNRGTLNNALVKKSIMRELKPVFKPEFGLSGGEDSFFFEQLIRKGYIFISCKDALVYETIPPSRANCSYIIKRTILEGGNTMRGVRMVKVKKHQFISVFKSTGKAILYVFLLFNCFFYDRNIFILYLLKLMWHIGFISEFLRLQVINSRNQIEKL